MASRILLRTARALTQPTSRTYYSTTPFRKPATTTKSTPSALKSTPQVPKAAASTNSGGGVAGAGNPDIIETFPSTANEVNVQAEPANGNGNAAPPLPDAGNGDGQGATDWSKSYHGLSTQAFAKEIAEVLLSPLDPLDVEMKPGQCLFLTLIITSFIIPFLRLLFEHSIG